MPGLANPSKRSILSNLNRVGLWLILALAGPSATNANPLASPTTPPVDFNREILPILADNCFECHGPDQHSRKGDLRLDVAEEAHRSAIVPGNAQVSSLVERLLTHDADDRMPPPESPRQPTSKQIEKIIQWIDQGAEYDQHWSFVAPSRPQQPSVSDPNWGRNGIDAFVLALLEAKGLRPQNDVAPDILARRLHLLLTGLPALPDETEAFEQAYLADPDAAIEERVDALLVSKAFGEHFAWSWMDAGRYADTNGYQGDGERIMWPWRDWLINALNENRPFDVLTKQMLAGDLLAEVDWESADWIPDSQKNDLLMATGFLRNHRYDTGSGTIPEESQFENAADRLETVGTVWMGLTLQCARCHTHKFDPIEQREYYQLFSFFDNVPEFGSALRNASHPYIHTPVGADRDKLLKIQAEAEAVASEWHQATTMLGHEQTRWERSIVNSPRVLRGLKHRYAESVLTFDGTNAIEKESDPIKLCAGNKTWTISFWFRPADLETGAIFSSVEEPDRYRPGIQADWLGDRLRIRHVCRWVNSYTEFESREKLEAGQWYHVSFRSDGRMQGLGYKASLNGEDSAMVCTHPVTNDSANNAGKAPLVLGGSPLLPGFRGSLRDLRFYDRFLQPGEVASLGDSRSLEALVRIPVQERTPTEKRTLQLAFLESDSLPDKLTSLRDRFFATQAELREAIKSMPTTMVMKDVDRGPTRLHPNGTYDTRTEEVEPGVPAFLETQESAKSDRLELANWLIDPEHPLTSRVAVNRIWQQLWGKGFVDSPENFGIQCAEPIHSGLLDWLATEYIRLDWDSKALIKLIVTSRAFRQDSAASETLWAEDPENRLLARGPRFRLPIQMVRDQALHLSGRLDDTVGGPPVLIDQVRGKDEKIKKLPYEQSDRRRTIYTFWKRNAAHPMLAVFDVADRNQCDVRERRTNTPLQALVTLNEPGLAASARDLAKRAQQSADHEASQLGWIWKACTGREPNAQEADRLAGTLERYRIATDGDNDLAWAALANVLLNLDSTLSIE